MVEEVDDLDMVGECCMCEREPDSYEWVWYARLGDCRWVFCQDCGVDDKTYDAIHRAAPVALTDDRTGDRFVRLVNIDEWFDEDKDDSEPVMVLSDEFEVMLNEMGKGTD